MEMSEFYFTRTTPGRTDGRADIATKADLLNHYWRNFFSFRSTLAPEVKHIRITQLPLCQYLK